MSHDTSHGTSHVPWEFLWDVPWEFLCGVPWDVPWAEKIYPGTGAFWKFSVYFVIFTVSSETIFFQNIVAALNLATADLQTH